MTACAKIQRIVGVSVAMLCLATSLSFPVSADETKTESKPAQSGLHGLLPAKLPAQLSSKSLKSLGDEQSAWANEVQAALDKIKDSSSTSAQQREQLEFLEIKLDELAKLRGESDAAVEIHASLNRFVDLGLTTLNTLDYNPAKQASELELARKDLEAKAKSLNNFLKNITNGDGWVSYLDTNKYGELAKQSSDAASLKLAGLRERLTAAAKTDDESQRKFLNKAEFQSTGKAIDRYLAAAKAPPVDEKKKDQSELRGHLAQLLTAVNEYDAESNSVAARQISASFQAAKGLAPDGGKLLENAMRNHYFNYNLRVVASEFLLNRLITQKRIDEGKVDDFVLGARIDGTQKTEATVGLDLKEGKDRIRFQITLKGTSKTDTRGITSRATVFTRGNHTFNAQKEVTFDGDEFTTGEAKINVDANNDTYAAQSSGGSRTGIVARIAVRTARRKRAQSEAIAEQKMRERLKPEFNDEIDTMFVSLNKKVGGLNPALKELGLFPSLRSYTTTEDSLNVNTRLMSDTEVAGGISSSPIQSEKGLVLQIHESLLNNALDRMNLAGKTLDEAGLKAELEKMVSTFLGREYHFPAPAEGEAKKQDKTQFVFPKEDVIRLQFIDGGLRLTLTTGLKPEKGEEIPTQRISVPISFDIDGDKLVAEAGKVSVSPVEKPKSRFKQIARAGVVRKKIEAALPKRELKRHFSIKLDGQEPLKISLAQIKSAGEWLTIVVE